MRSSGPSSANAPYLVENAAWVRYWYQTAIFNWPTNLTMFLLGLLAGRRNILVKLSDRPRALAAIAAAGLAVGTALYLVNRGVHSALGDASVKIAIGSLLFTFHCWGMSSAYAATLLLVLRTVTGSAMLSPLAAIGRLALTNYLLQAAIAVPVCLAFGLFDTFTPTRSLLFVAAILAVEVPFSLFWAKGSSSGRPNGRGAC